MFLALIGISDICLLILYFTVIFILGLKILFNRKSVSQNMTYNFSVFVTPVISFILYITTPISQVLDKSNQYRLLIFYFMLIILNIVNYFLLNNIVQVIFLKEHEKVITKQLFFQTEKYNQTIRILHDVDKHIRAIENLYGTEREHTAGEYAEAIRSTLAPLIPMSYTENPILNILLTDKNAVMQEKGIHSDIKIDNVELSYIEPIDITTIFGNLLDNAIEAAANVDGEKYIFIKISAYHKMTVVHIENSCGNVKWKKRMPVSDKGKGRGIGLLNVKQSIDKYDGNLQLKQDGNKFVADLFLNS